MNESQRLWEKYGTIDNLLGYEHRHFSVNDVDKLLSDYSPWVTDREPTREDGDENGKVLIRIKYANKDGYSYEVESVKEAKASGCQWMRIPK